MDTTHSSWIPLAETAIRSLRDVDAVRIQTAGDDISEIHVVSSSRRPAKQIVRDIQTLLLTRFQRPIDFRVVSVAFTDRPIAHEPEPEPEPVAGHAPATGGPAPPPARPAPVPANGPTAHVHERSDIDEEPTEDDLPDDRIRFDSVNVYVSGRRAQAQVELRWRGIPRMGSASGWGTREGALRLVAQATVSTVLEFLDDGVAFSLDTVQILTIGRGEVALVVIELLGHRAQKRLAGSCAVEQDAQEAVVLATLSALNRIVGGLPGKEPTEYVLRPTSS